MRTQRTLPSLALASLLALLLVAAPALAEQPIGLCDPANAPTPECVQMGPDIHTPSGSGPSSAQPTSPDPSNGTPPAPPTTDPQPPQTQPEPTTLDLTGGPADGAVYRAGQALTWNFSTKNASRVECTVTDLTYNSGANVSGMYPGSDCTGGTYTYTPQSAGASYTLRIVAYDGNGAGVQTIERRWSTATDFSAIYTLFGGSISRRALSVRAECREGRGCLGGRWTVRRARTACQVATSSRCAVGPVLAAGTIKETPRDMGRTLRARVRKGSKLPRRLRVVVTFTSRAGTRQAVTYLRGPR